MTAQWKYTVEVRHDGLHKHRVLSGTDKRILEEKARAQMATWDAMWAKKVMKEAVRAQTEANRIAKQQAIQRKREEKEEKKETALAQTNEAKQAIENIKMILQKSLESDDLIDFELLKDNSEFKKPTPQKNLPSKPQKGYLPSKPDQSQSLYQPNLNIFDKIFKKRAARKFEEAKAALESAMIKWEKEREEVDLRNSKMEEEYVVALKEAEEKYTEELAMWEKEKEAFLSEQQEKNDAVDRRKEEYSHGSSDAVIELCELVLTLSDYPESFPQEFEIDYNSDTKILVVDYLLPSPEALPRTKEIKYIQSRDELKEVELPQAQRNRLYDNMIYQIAIRTIHEIYRADIAHTLESIVFNGWVKFINKGTGQEESACILSVQATRSEFVPINLGLVDPKECFKTLKGVGSAKLYGLSPIAPLIQIEREDKRFISSYAVAHKLDDSVNIAAMDWEDFKHLVRELFEKEFTQGGGEVKVTQASHDGGVDAIAFDPDPIRGGKLVIQAKRYTNVVGVSAVRDLFGTVMNEGAIKGILITTAEYGSDAYEFAKGKPLTLLTGGNLLHLLAKHGYKAKIDLKEAKQILADKKREQEK